MSSTPIWLKKEATYTFKGLEDHLSRDVDCYRTDYKGYELAVFDTEIEYLGIIAMVRKDGEIIYREEYECLEEAKKNAIKWVDGMLLIG